MRSDWLSPLRSVLAERDAPLTVFFRDDDAGWDDVRLNALLDCFAPTATPIDLAVIPASIGEPLADSLLERRARNPAVLGLHQHGYAHVNHESEGRKCEFGPARASEDQHRDLLAGKERLTRLLGPALDSLFTPPWNRCTEITGECLAALGFSGLSRDRTALPLQRDDLPELPVHIDWCGIRARSNSPWEDLGKALALHVVNPPESAVGIMLHHAVMDEDDLGHLDGLLALLAGDGTVHRRLMRQCLSPDRP